MSTTRESLGQEVLDALYTCKSLTSPNFALGWQETGESVWEHPLLGYFQGEIFMRRGGKAKLQEAEASNPCTEDEVGAMAEYLEVTPEDPSAVRDVARMAINAPLPPGWEDISDEATGEAAFKNFDSGEVVDQHPLDDYFFELVRRRRAAVRKVS